MCGIAGILSYRESGPPVAPAELLAIRDAMSARGPDGEGLWISGDRRVGLAHRRLAIIDLSQNGAQPMTSADGRLQITFNGEIYNYRELRAGLSAKGYQFRSTSDTEVLLNLYLERGPAMVETLRGMFTFALWDERSRSLLLARDPFGIKPLYYADDGNTIRFASQVKALLAGRKIESSPDAAGHVGFFILGSVPEPFTMYKSIRALPAGSILTVSEAHPARVTTYFNVAQELLQCAGNTIADKDGTRAAVAEALRDSVRHHLVADVPVGMFLSSGLDSSTLAALACEVQGTEMRTVTLGFDEYRGTPLDETPLAVAIARQLGTRHETRWITRETFESDFERLLEAMDQPSIDGVNTYFVSKVAAECGMKVAISGLGGDELFGGYPSFRDVPRIMRLFSRFGALEGARKLSRQLAAPFVGRLSSPKFASLFEYGGSYAGAYLLRRALYMPWELDQFVDPAFVAEGCERLQLLQTLQGSISGLSNERHIVTALETSWYMRNQLLRDADWAGMAHSLEIRVPFVDVTLFRKVAPWLASAAPPTKLDMAATPAKPLPAQALQRKKTGFSIPVRSWNSDSPGHASARGLRSWSRTVFERYLQPRGTILISTQAPGQGGGVASMAERVARCLQKGGRDVAVAYNMPYSMAPELSVPFWRIPFKRPGLRYATAFGDIPAYEIGFRFPELEFVRYFPSSRWKAVASRFQRCVAVTGSIHAALPVSLQHKKCLAWVATPYLPDKVDRARSLPWYRRLVDDLINTRMCLALEKVGVRTCHVLALSHYTARALERLSPRTQISHMPMPVDRNLYFPESERVVVGRIGFSGRLTDPRKNVGLLLNAQAICRSRGIDVTAHLVGGDVDHNLESLIERLGLHNCVEIWGERPRSALPGFYQQLDVFVIPSHQEGLGIVGVEAMACGCPVVSTRCGGVEDYVRDGTNGFLVGFSPDEMADAIGRIVKDRQMRRSMSEAAIATVQREYTDDVMEHVFWTAFEETFGEAA